MLVRHEPKSHCLPKASRSQHWITPLASSSAFEAYFVRLGSNASQAWGVRNGITASSLFRCGRRNGKSNGSGGANTAHVTTFVESADSRSRGRSRGATVDKPRSRH